MSTWRGRLVSAGWGAAGVAAALFLYHLWTDHVAFHAIVNFINEHGPAIQKLPR